MRVCLTNMGCKLNQAEVERMARGFLAAGWRVVGSLEEADLHVINSCTVTHVAARQARKLARRGGRLHPGLKTVVTGCYASESPEEAAALAGVDLVVPNSDKERLVERVLAAFPTADRAAGRPVPADPTADPDLPYAVLPDGPLPGGHTRAMVKVGDGCNMRCSFCIIPFTRGGESSRSPAEVVAEVRGLAAAGYREAVITGVQISSYRHDGWKLYDLTRALLHDTPVERLRLTSIAPWDFDPRLFDLFADRRLCRHIHMSLQSGSDGVLKRMRRPHDAAAYAALLAEIRRQIPGVAVTTDVIVGFPGESAAEHRESLAFVERCAFARVHVFPYSRRPGTHADSLPDHLPPPAIKERTAEMLEVAAACQRRFHRRHLGDTVEVLWEDRRRGRWQGLTDNYIRVVSAFDDGTGGDGTGDEASAGDLSNRILPAKLTALADEGMVGRLVA